MLDELISTIDKVKQTIKEHSTSLAKSEKRTRPVLIDPILNVLGWDVADPSCVKIEYNLRDFPNQQVDYALCHGNRVVVFIEAKKLFEPLQHHVQQMVNYAVGEGISYAILTDGNIWDMYDVLKPLPLNDKKIVHIDLSSSTTVSCALNFLRLWRLNLQSAAPIDVPDPIIAAKTSEPDSPVMKRRTNHKHTEKPSDWIAIPNFIPEPGSKPSYIQFKDGPSKRISHWNEILIESAQRAISIGQLTEASVPLGLTSKRFYIHTQPRHPDGTPFTVPRYIENRKFVIEAHGNISALVKKVTHLWNFLGLPVSEIFIKQSH